jgi:uncharacterized protein YjdB
MLRTYKRAMSVLILGGVFALAACDDSPVDPPPTPSPAAVEVTPAELTLNSIGATGELSATVFDEDGVEISGAEVSWSSSDASVASVGSNGLVTAESNGSATITAESGDASGSATVTVDAPEAVPTEIVLSPEAATLTEVGATTQFTATVLDEDGIEIEDAVVTWASSDTDIAVVDEDGLVEAVAEGTANITAESGDASASAEVTVDLSAAVPAEIVLSPEAATITEIGATTQFTATVLDEDGIEIEDAVVTWASSDTDIAVVDEDGLVEAVAEGTANITAESGDASASAEVTVDLSAAVPAEIVLSPEAATITEIGATTQFTATVLDEDGIEIEDAVVTWASSDTDIAVVDEDGLVEAVAEGTANITAEIGDVSASAEVTVDLDG